MRESASRLHSQALTNEREATSQPASQLATTTTNKCVQMILAVDQLTLTRLTSQQQRQPLSSLRQRVAKPADDDDDDDGAAEKPGLPFASFRFGTIIIITVSSQPASRTNPLAAAAYRVQPLGSFISFKWLLRGFQHEPPPPSSSRRLSHQATTRQHTVGSSDAAAAEVAAALLVSSLLRSTPLIALLS